MILASRVIAKENVAVGGLASREWCRSAVAGRDTKILGPDFGRLVGEGAVPRTRASLCSRGRRGETALSTHPMAARGNRLNNTPVLRGQLPLNKIT